MSSAIKVKISAETAEFKSGLSEVKTSAKEFASEVKSQFAAAFAIGAIVAGMRSAVERFGDVGDLAERFNVSAEALQRLGYAGEQSGTSMEAVAKGLSKMRTAMAEAATKGGEAAKVFTDAGISAEQLSSGAVGSEEAFFRIADAVSNARSELEQVAIANAVFGSKLGGELVPMLALGRKGLEELGGSAAVLSERMVSSLKQADDSLKDLKNTFTVVLGYVAYAINALAVTVDVAVAAFVSALAVMGRAAVRFAGVLKDALTPGGAGIREGMRDFVKQSLADMDAAFDVVNDKMTKARTKLGFGKIEAAPERKGGTPGLAPEDKKAAEEQQKLEAELAAIRRKSDEARMTAQERINALTERHAKLTQEAAAAGLRTIEGLKKQIEAAKVLEELDRETKTRDEKEKRDAEELARIRRQVFDAQDANLEKVKTKAETLAGLSEREEELRKEADAAPDLRTKGEKLIEAERLKGRRIDLERDSRKAPAGIPTVDSLRAIGGGASGSIGPSVDASLAEQKRANDLLRDIREHLKALNSRSPGGFTVTT